MLDLLQAASPGLSQYGRMILVAVVYSLTAYSGKWLKNGEVFKEQKFIRTVVVGVIVGAVAAQTGAKLSVGTVPQMATSVGAIHAAEVITDAILGSAHRLGMGSSEETENTDG